MHSNAYMQNNSVFVDIDVDWERYCFQKLIFLWSSLFINTSFLCYNCFFFFQDRTLYCDWETEKNLIEEDDGQPSLEMLRSSEPSPLAFSEHDFTGRHTALLTPSPLPSRVHLSPGLLMQARASLQQLNLQPPPTPIGRASPTSVGFLQYLDNQLTASSERERVARWFGGSHG